VTGQILIYPYKFDHNFSSYFSIHVRVANVIEPPTFKIFNYI
jgi:hypothetical protein